MKRIKDPERYRQHQRRRTKDSLKSRRHHENYVAVKRKLQLGLAREKYRQYTPHRIPGPPQYTTVRAPNHLSLVNNPDQTIPFVERLHRLYLAKTPAWLSLKEVERLDYDAVVVLLAVLINFRRAEVPFNGDMPRDPGVTGVLRRSNFFKLLTGPIASRDEYEMGKASSIHTHAKREVDPKLAASLVARASKTVWGEERRCPGVQRVFLELMQNTNNHASRKGRGEEYWWVSAYHHEEGKKVAFTFVDFGIGIFESLEERLKIGKLRRWPSKQYDLFSEVTNPEILRAILERSIHQSITRQYFRGKGLPGIADVLLRNQISNLIIITNNVYGAIARKRYTELAVPFSGTLVYWELEKKNASAPTAV
jgi:hypothetical protein